MEHHISEADWKRLRRLAPVALGRFCQRALTEITQIAADATKSSHERYRDVFRRLKERDAELASAFDDLRRSMALYQLARMVSLKIVTDDELADFDANTRGMLAMLAV